MTAGGSTLCPVCQRPLPRPKTSRLRDPTEGRTPCHYRRRQDERVDVLHDDGTRCVIDRGVYDLLVERTRLVEGTTRTHVDDFIDAPGSDPYAVRWFESFRRPALVKLKDPNPDRLFATFEGRRWRVTGCSRLGDVWLHSDFGEGVTYERRVDVAACAGWGPEP